MNTGAVPVQNGQSRGNGAILAAAPYLVTEDILCYLDDDNWYDEHHISTLVHFMLTHQLDYAYSLRRLYHQESYKFLCNDDRYSLGFWYTPNTYQFSFTLEDIQHNFIDSAPHLIDTNCIALARSCCFETCQEWYQGFCNDKYVTEKLFSLTQQIKGGCTGVRSVNYLFSLNRKDKEKLLKIKGKEYYKKYEQELYQHIIHIIEQDFKQNTPCPWLMPTIYYQGILARV